MNARPALAVDDRAVAGTAGAILVAAALGDEGLRALARRLDAAHVVDAAAPPPQPGEAVAALEARYGMTVGQFAQAQPSFSARYAPGITILPAANSADRLGRQFVGELGHWERIFAARKPRALIVRQGTPLAAVLVARAQGCAIRSLESLPGGLAFWSPDASGGFTSAGRQASAVDLWARLTNAAVDRVHAFGGGVSRSLARYLQQRGWTSGGFAAALPQAPTLLFVLEAEPSLAVVRHSPDFTNQHVAIVALSRDLPAGARIAVLEHPDMPGRRPPNFYRQLRDLKNVVLLPPDTAVAGAIRSSQAVAGIAGEALVYAALIGKPVVALGRYFPARSWSNVRSVGDLGNMRAEISAALAGCDEAAARDENVRIVSRFCFAVDGANDLPRPELD